MIKVKSIGPASDAGMQSMGAEFMTRIGDKTARALCGMFPVPRMGNEVCVALKRDNLGVNSRLFVQNISGQYFLVSCNVPMGEWPDVFGVEVQP